MGLFQLIRKYASLQERVLDPNLRNVDFEELRPVRSFYLSRS